MVCRAILAKIPYIQKGNMSEFLYFSHFCQLLIGRYITTFFNLKKKAKRFSTFERIFIFP